MVGRGGCRLYRLRYVYAERVLVMVFGRGCLLRSRRAGGGFGHSECFLVNAERFRANRAKHADRRLAHRRSEFARAHSLTLRSLRQTDIALAGGGERKSTTFFLIPLPTPDFMAFMQNSRLLRSRRAGGRYGDTDWEFVRNSAVES